MDGTWILVEPPPRGTVIFKSRATRSNKDAETIVLSMGSITVLCLLIYFTTTYSTRLIDDTQRGRFVNAKSASQEAPMHSLDRKRSEYDCIR